MNVYNVVSIMISSYRLKWVRKRSITPRNSQECMEVDRLLCSRTMQCLIDQTTASGQETLVALSSQATTVLCSIDSPFHRGPQKGQHHGIPSIVRPSKSGQCRTQRNLSVEIVGAKVIPFIELLTHVNLSIAESNRLEIANEELSVIESDVAKLLQPLPRRHNRDRSGNNSGSQFALDDEIARIVVYPHK